VVLGRREADVEVEPERPRHLLGEGLTAGRPGHAVDDLAHQPAVGDGVVAVVASRLPLRSRGRQRLDRHRPPRDLFGRERAANGGQPGLVAEQPAHRQLVLALGGELGPVAGNRCIQVELAALGQAVRHDRQRPLGRRRHHLEGAVRVGIVALGLGGAAPQVDHRLAAAVHAAGGAHLAPLRKVALELVPHRLEAGRYRAPDVHRAHATREGRAAVAPRVRGAGRGDE
jgi:hypothetical protein